MKKEKKHLAAISLISSENSSSFSKGCEETSGRPMEKKRQKLQEARQENGEDPSVSFSKPKKKKSFSQGGAGDLEEVIFKRELAVEVFL